MRVVRAIFMLQLAAFGCRWVCAGDPATVFRDLVEKHFPAEYAEARSGYGIEFHTDEGWEPLPEALPDRITVLIHGVDEPGRLWVDLIPRLDAAGFPACRFTYPNDQSIRDSAAFLSDCLIQLSSRGVTRIAIVAHSMGGLVAREALTNPVLGYTEQVERETVPCVVALIMVGTPNHGSALAALRGIAEIRDQFFRLVRGDGHLFGGLADGCGEAGKDLMPDSEFLKTLNARPNPENVSLTIVAGIASPLTGDALDAYVRKLADVLPNVDEEAARRVRDSLRQVTEGIGDGAVSLESTKLDGVEDHVVVKADHISMLHTEIGSRLPPAVPVVIDRLRRVWQQP
jgi:pimeloyl-ACP methyl ester carboxylesterase